MILILAWCIHHCIHWSIFSVLGVISRHKTSALTMQTLEWILLVFFKTFHQLRNTSYYRTWPGCCTHPIHVTAPAQCIYIYIYTLGKKGCYTPIEDNKTNVDRSFVFPLGWNWHDMDPWLFPNEIRHYLGQTFNARSSRIVELRNHSIGGRSPKSIFTLWQLWINICIFL